MRCSAWHTTYAHTPAEKMDQPQSQHSITNVSGVRMRQQQHRPLLCFPRMSMS